MQILTAVPSLATAVGLLMPEHLTGRTWSAPQAPLTTTQTGHKKLSAAVRSLAAPVGLLKPHLAPVGLLKPHLVDAQHVTIDKERAGVLVGSGMGGLTVFSDGVQALIERGYRKITPFFIPYAITNMGSALLGIDLGFMGPNYCISTACATSNYCFYAAANHIRRGEADLMIAGGTEAAIIPIGLGGFVACRALSQRNDDPKTASRPWDKDRDGSVMGEGAGVLVMESLEHAMKRGAPIIAEYLGGAVNCDAYHMTDPRSDGLGVSSCIQSSLEDAGVSPEEQHEVNVAISNSFGFGGHNPVVAFSAFRP